jgi:hypothetical protein
MESQSKSGRHTLTETIQIYLPRYYGMSMRKAPIVMLQTIQVVDLSLKNQIEIGNGRNSDSDIFNLQIRLTIHSNIVEQSLFENIVASSPPATEEIGTMSREVESHEGKGW